MAGIYQGQWTGPEIDAAIGRTIQIANQNLLDNWFFLNNFAINQRGKTAYSVADEFMFDRWKHGGTAGDITVGDGVLIGNGLIGNGMNMQQRIGEVTILSGNVYTLSLLLSDGTLFTSSDVLISGGSGVSDWQILAGYLDWDGVAIRNMGDGTFQVAVFGSGTRRVMAVKLELGDHQTLCHNAGTESNPVWLFNAIPDRALELMKCYHFFYKYSGLTTASTLPGTTVSACTIPFPVPMRAAPSISEITTFDEKTYTGNSAYLSGVRFYNSASVAFSITGFEASAEL